MHSFAKTICRITISLAAIAWPLVTAAPPRVPWSPIGPGGGGWMTAITVINDATNTIYAACDVGGVYKSTDHGATWEIKNSGISMYYVQDIAFDPSTPTTLYAATRGGVYKSTDGADHWESKRNGFPPPSDFTFSAPISDIAVDPEDPTIVYAAVGVPRSGYELDGYHWQSTEVKGAFYKSVDSGESWSLNQGTGIDSSAMIYSLVIDPSDSTVLYAATSTGVYRSDSAGASWVPINTGLPHLLAMALVIDPAHPATLYVTMWAEPGSEVWQGGVYKSLDHGNSWIAKNSGLPQVVGTEEGLTSNYPSLVIDGQDSQTLYVGNNCWTPDPGVYKSINGGENWSWVSRAEDPDKNTDIGWIDEDGLGVKCLAIDPGDSERLYFGTSTHLFKTTDAGAAWTQIYSNPTGDDYWQGRGLETTCVQDIAVDPTDSDIIYTGYWDMGFLKSVDGGVSFKRTFDGMNYNANTFSIVVDPTHTNVVFAATGWWESNEGEVCVSEDHGETWTVRSNGLPDAQIWSIALDESSSPESRTLYATSYENGVYKTVDGGLLWTFSGSGLGETTNKQVRKVVIDPGDPHVLYAGIEAKHVETGDQSDTIQGGLYKSTDAGSSWARIDLDLPQLSVWDIAVDPNDSQIVYTAVAHEYDHTQETNYDGGVYKSIDGGASWTNSSNGFGTLGDLAVVSLAISPEDSSTLYAVTSDAPFHDLSSGRGVFMTTDGGSEWAPVNDDLSVLYFGVITIDPSDASRLYAGSSGNGIIRGFVCKDPDDCDGDGVLDDDDCAPLNAAVSQSAGPARELHWSEGSTTTLRWTPGTETAFSNVYRGLFDSSVFDPNWPCLAADIPSPTYNDVESPDPAAGFHYLVTGENVCGESDAGRDSDGTPRTIEPCP